LVERQLFGNNNRGRFECCRFGAVMWLTPEVPGAYHLSCTKGESDAG
jgi:hypothetical protein